MRRGMRWIPFHGISPGLAMLVVSTGIAQGMLERSEAGEVSPPSFNLRR
jgi:hypothetical protein